MVITPTASSSRGAARRQKPRSRRRAARSAPARLITHGEVRLSRTRESFCAQGNVYSGGCKTKFNSAIRGEAGRFGKIRERTESGNNIFIAARCRDERIQNRAMLFSQELRDDFTSFIYAFYMVYRVI